jgi:hypothetical protein
MKSISNLLMVASLFMLTADLRAQSATPPKYDRTTEAVFHGIVQKVQDRKCPVSGGMGSHVVMKLSDGKVFEVHISTTRFVHQYELLLHVGDELEVTGSKVKFEGVETILARKIRRGTDEFLFRDDQGNPIW